MEGGGSAGPQAPSPLGSAIGLVLLFSHSSHLPLQSSSNPKNRRFAFLVGLLFLTSINSVLDRLNFRLSEFYIYVDFSLELVDSSLWFSQLCLESVIQFLTFWYSALLSRFSILSIMKLHSLREIMMLSPFSSSEAELVCPVCPRGDTSCLLRFLLLFCCCTIRLHNACNIFMNEGPGTN